MFSSKARGPRPTKRLATPKRITEERLQTSRFEERMHGAIPAASRGRIAIQLQADLSLQATGLMTVATAHLSLICSLQLRASKCSTAARSFQFVGQQNSRTGRSSTLTGSGCTAPS